MFYRIFVLFKVKIRCENCRFDYMKIIIYIVTYPSFFVNNKPGAFFKISKKADELILKYHRYKIINPVWTQNICKVTFRLLIFVKICL